MSKPFYLFAISDRHLRGCAPQRSHRSLLPSPFPLALFCRLLPLFFIRPERSVGKGYRGTRDKGQGGKCGESLLEVPYLRRIIPAYEKNNVPPVAFGRHFHPDPLFPVLCENNSVKGDLHRCRPRRLYFDPDPG